MIDKSVVVDSQSYIRGSLIRKSRNMDSSAWSCVSTLGIKDASATETNQELRNSVLLNTLVFLFFSRTLIIFFGQNKLTSVCSSGAINTSRRRSMTNRTMTPHSGTSV